MKAIQFDFTLPRYALGMAVGKVMSRALWSGLSCTRYLEIPEPDLPGDEWVRIRTLYGGICGSDLGTIRLNTSPYFSPLTSFPYVLGHEGIGHVVEVGSAVDDFRPGDKVVVEPLLWCVPRGVSPLCGFCQRGEISLCENVTNGRLAPGMSIGFCRDTGGTWSDVFVAHGSQLYRVPDGVNDLNALMVEPFSSGLHPVLQNFPGDDETVLILGAGAIGLCVLASLRALGSRSRILVLARYAFQAEAAKRLGASEVVPVSRGIDVFEEVAERTGARVMKPIVGRPIMVGGVDRTFECIGSTISIDNALRMTRAGGRAVLVGMPGTTRLDWSSIFVKELEVCASLAYHRAEEYEGARQSTFEIAFRLMQRGKVKLDWMVTHTFRLRDYKRALEMLTHRGRHGVIKAAFVFDR